MGLPRLRTFAGTDLGAVSRLAAESDGSDGLQVDGHLQIARLTWGYPAYVGLPCLRGVINAMRFAGTDFEVVSRPNFLQKSLSSPLDLGRTERIVLVRALPFSRAEYLVLHRRIVDIAVIFQAFVAVFLELDDVKASEC